MRCFAFVAALVLAGPALAHHPEGRLDEEMARREPAFEATDSWSKPNADLTEADAEFDLTALGDQILVLSFIPDGCGEPCAAQQALLGEVLDSISVTPMRHMVMFLTVGSGEIATDDATASNARTALLAGDQGVQTLADRFAAMSVRDGNLPQVHVIDRRGRHAGIFHGAEFGRVNLVLYINGLTNAQPQEPPFWNRVLSFLR